MTVKLNKKQYRLEISNWVQANWYEEGYRMYMLNTLDDEEEKSDLYLGGLYEVKTDGLKRLKRIRSAENDDEVRLQIKQILDTKPDACAIE